MGNCKYCGENVVAKAKKCKICGEPQGWRVWPTGMLLKFVPFVSIAITVASLIFACMESRAAAQAKRREDLATSQAAVAKKQAVVAESAAADVAARLPTSTRQTMVKDLRLRPKRHVIQ